MVRKRYATELGKKKVQANNKLKYEVRQGRILRPDKCQKCGKACKPDGHHWDYDLPLDVIWLCKMCHNALHRAQGLKAKANPENA